MSKVMLATFATLMFTKMACHILSAHKNEPDVIKIDAIPANNNENRRRRGRELDRIRLKGDFYHNLKVLKSGGKLASHSRGVQCSKKLTLFRNIFHVPFQNHDHIYSFPNVMFKATLFVEYSVLY